MVEALIAAHIAAWRHFDAACEATDTATEAKSGATIIALAEALQDKASDATRDAMYAIIEHPYATLDELRRGIAYIVEHHRTTGDGDPRVWLTELACSVAGIDGEGL